MMLSHRCPECGLENIPERTTCKRCRAPLSPAHAGAGPSSLQPQTTITSETTGISMLLPTRSFTVFTPQPIDAVRTRLRQALATEIVRSSGAGFLEMHLTYRGSLTEQRVRLSGPYGNRQWSLDAQGALEPLGGGTSISLRVRPTGASILMMVLALGLWLGMTMAMTGRSWMFLGPLALGAMLYAVMTIGMKASASDSARIIAELITAPPGSAPSAERAQ